MTERRSSSGSGIVTRESAIGSDGRLSGSTADNKGPVMARESVGVVDGRNHGLV